MSACIARACVAALLACLSVAALSARAEDPEAVYAKFHRAAAAGDLAEMLRYAPEARRAEVAAMSAAQKDAEAKMAAAMLPRAFLVRQKSLEPGGQAARLVVSGPGEPLSDGKPETLYGTIRMVMERGAWKVADSKWTNETPAGLANARGAAPKKAAAAPAVSTRGAAPVGSIDAAPEHKLGRAKPPCVYKPVMTEEDLANCR